MAYELKDGQGSLFKNDRKESETHADYTGAVMVGGQEYWLNAWVKRSVGKAPFFSLSLKPKQAKAAPAPAAAKSPDPDDDLPF